MQIFATYGLMFVCRFFYFPNYRNNETLTDSDHNNRKTSNKLFKFLMERRGEFAYALIKKILLRMRKNHETTDNWSN